MPDSEIVCAQPKFCEAASTGGSSVDNVPYLNVLGFQRNILISPASANLVLPSEPKEFAYGPPATTKFSSVLIDNDSPNLVVTSLPAVVVTVDSVSKFCPAVASLLNKKFTLPCPSAGDDTAIALPSFLATIFCPKCWSAPLLFGDNLCVIV